MAKPLRMVAEGPLPLIDVEGTAYECGRQLGFTWREALVMEAQGRAKDNEPWFKDRRVRKLVERYAPHLPEVHRGMAQSAGVAENLMATRLKVADGGCTSFAIAPAATLDGHVIAGQTKDIGPNRISQFQVLRMKMKDAPSVLTLTYAGWIFGHGFVEGGCAIFRNSLFAGVPHRGLLTYGIWGMLAMHCPTVDDVIEMTNRYGVNAPAHCTVADAKGGIAGFEFTKVGTAILKPKRGIYTHANCVYGNKAARKFERDEGEFTRADSECRTERMYEILARQHGRLTAQLAFYALADDVGYPIGICRYPRKYGDACTGAVVVVEPTRGKLHACRGLPSQNWPQTFSL